MKLKDQTKYDLAVEALKSLGLNVGEFCVMTRAMDIIESLKDPEQFEPNATFEDLRDDWGDFAYDEYTSELEEAWGLIEGH
jgi:hypothetical protein